MMKKKQNATRKWLPLIFATVLSMGCADGVVAQNDKISPAEPALAAPDAQQGNLGFIVEDLARRFPGYSTDTVLLVDVTDQKMLLLEAGQVTREWVVSTATAGIGSRKGSNKTPLGVHRVAQKFGDGAPLGTIFKARQNTGRIAEILTGADQRSTADNVTTRILWLDGLEPGLNKGGNVDSRERYIYIHGTDEEGRLGTPASHGCIRMNNRDVVEVFERIAEDTLVLITQQRQD